MANSEEVAICGSSSPSHEVSFSRRGDHLAILAQPCQVGRDRPLNPVSDLPPRVPGRYASGKIQGIGAEPGRGALNSD